jgi:putative transposase
MKEGGSGDRNAGTTVGYNTRAGGEIALPVEVMTAPQSPWQNPYVERLIGSIRRECLNHVIVFNEAHLRRILSRYFNYYQNSRTRRAPDDDAPNPRVFEPPGRGRVAAIPQVGGCTIAIPA